MLKQAERVRSDYPTDEKNTRRRMPIEDVFGLIACATIFALALSLRYWYVFVSPHINVASVSDASEFLRNAQAMLNLSALPLSFWQEAGQALIGSPTPAALAHIKQTLSPLQGLYISGPVIPLFFGLCYLVSLTPFSFANCTPPLVGNVILSALTCVFFALTAQHTFDKKTGYLTGLLCAIYPAFIINSGRLYCETLAAFLLSAVCLLTVRGFAKELSTREAVGSALLTGFLAACLQFTRSITIVLTVALIPLLFLQQGLRKGSLVIPAFIVGFAVVALPWLGLQQLTFGSASLVVDRVGHYNFFMGNHVDGAGFVSFPYEDGSGVEKRPLPQLAKEAIQRSPSRWLHLMMQDKPLRLFSMPWNDFRAPLGPLEYQGQAIIHQLMLLLGAIGVALAFVIGPETLAGTTRFQLRPADTVTPAKVFLLSIFGLHCAYLFFITVPRYNLTVMPIVLIFAAAGISCLAALARERGGFTTLLGVVVSSLFLFATASIPLAAFVQLVGAKYVAVALVLQCALKFVAVASLAFCLWQSISTFLLGAKRTSSVAPSTAGAWVGKTAVAGLFIAALLTLVIPARGHGRWDEWQAPLTAGRTAEQHLVLPTRIVKDLVEQRRSAYLLIDTDGTDAAQSLKVSVNGKPVDAPAIAGNSLIDQGAFDLTMKMPSGGFMREGEWIFKCLTAPAGISNADLRQWFVVPLAPQLLAGKGDVIVNVRSNRGEAAAPVVFGNYGLKRKSVIPGVNTYSWEKTFFGVENQRGFCDTRYDAKLTDDLSVPQTKDMSGALGLQSGRYNIRLLADAFKPEVFGPPTSAALLDTPLLLPGLQQVAVVPVGTVRLSSRLSPYKATAGELPVFGNNDWWLVRVKGDVRRLAGAGDVALDVRAANQNDFYQSPWTGTLAVGEQWRTFDTAIPLMPGKLKNMLPTSLTCEFTARDLGVAADTEFKNVQLEVIQVPGNPLASGYEVF